MNLSRTTGWSRMTKMHLEPRIEGPPEPGSGRGFILLVLAFAVVVGVIAYIFF
jgi:hypothetical protein